MSKPLTLPSCDHTDEARREARELFRGVCPCCLLAVVRKYLRDTTDAQLVARQAAEVYEVYPLKVGRPAALRAIIKAINLHGAEFILERTKRFAEIRGDDKEYMPHPSTWFNQERYNDDEQTWRRVDANARKPSRNTGTYNDGLADQYANAAK